MTNIRLNLFIILIWILMSSLLIFALTMMQYYHVISKDKMGLYSFITLLIITLLLGFISGNIKNKSGLVNGILFPTFIIILFIFINIFTHTVTLQFSHIIKYIIFILTSGLGGIIGVNFKPMIK